MDLWFMGIHFKSGTWLPKRGLNSSMSTLSPAARGSPLNPHEFMPGYNQWSPNMPDMSGGIYQMSGRDLLLNSIKCPAGNSKCPAELKSFWQSLKMSDRAQKFLAITAGHIIHVIWILITHKSTVHACPDKCIGSNISNFQHSILMTSPI